MAPDTPLTFHEDYDVLYLELWEDLKKPEKLSDDLQAAWEVGTLHPFAEIIRTKLIDEQGHSRESIAMRAGCSTSAVTQLVNKQKFGPEVINRIFKGFQLPRPQPERRRIAGHCNAMGSIRREVLGKNAGVHPLSPAEFVLLYFLFNSGEWVNATRALARAKEARDPSRMSDAWDQLSRAATAIRDCATRYLRSINQGEAPTSVTGAKALQDLILGWGEAYLLYLPEVDPERELSALPEGSQDLAS
jgi:hypothetical protein